MQLKPYRDILKMAKEQIDSSLAPVRANRARKQAELEIAKLDEKLASQEASINELCSQKELNFDTIIRALDENALTARRKKQFQAIITQMFPS